MVCTLSRRARMPASLRVAIGVLLLASPAIVPTRAHAQTPAQLGARRDLIDRAQQADRAGNHAQALDLARRAGAIMMSTSLRLFIAQQEAATGQIAAAMGNADSCIREAERDATLQNRAAVITQCRDLLAQLRGRTGRITIHVPNPPPQGLRVMVSGEALDPALYDVGTIVAPGTIHVEASATNTAPFVRDVRVAAGEAIDVPVRFGGAAQSEPSPEPTGSSTAPVETLTTAASPSVGAIPPSVTHPAPRPIGALGATGLVVAGLGVAALGVGSYLYISTGQTYDQCAANGGCTLDMQPRSTEMAGIVLLWSGAALGVAGLGTFVIDRLMGGSHRETVRAVWIDPRGGLFVGGRF